MDWLALFSFIVVPLGYQPNIPRSFDCNIVSRFKEFLDFPSLKLHIIKRDERAIGTVYCHLI